MTVVPSQLTPSVADDGAPRFAPYASVRFPIDVYDYVESEWIASGSEDGNSYETTVLVRLPRDRSRFSGVVLVEPLHAHGIAPMSLYSSTYIMRSGHGWAMVAAQRTTIHDHVRNADPDRYASLHIAGPGDGTLGGEVPFDNPGAMSEFWARVKATNRASSTILAQVGAALRDGAVVDGHRVDHLLLMGHSQTGSVVTYYIDEAHESQRFADGRPVYDGYCPTGFPTRPFGACDVPIVQIVSDGDVSDPLGTFVVDYPGRQYRRADSDAPTDRYRLYELAGVPHMGTRYAPFDDVALWQHGPGGAGLGTDSRMNTLPHNELFNAGLHHLVAWVADGTAPPRAERIETRADGRFEVDDIGNSIGGVRCVQMDVPRARYLPNAPTLDGKPSVATIGTEVPLSPSEMAARHGTADRYRQRFDSRLAELVNEGWLLPEDVDYMRDDLDLIPDFP